MALGGARGGDEERRFRDELARQQGQPEPEREPPKTSEDARRAEPSEEAGAREAAPDPDQDLVLGPVGKHVDTRA